MISEIISNKVLLVGPDYVNHRGGIGALIDVHKNQYEVFHFIPSFRSFKTKSTKSFFFLRQLIKIIFFLLKNKQIKIVHVHSAKNGSLYRKLIVVYIAKVFFRKKVINHVHTGHFKHFYDDSSWLGKKIVRFFLNLNDVTITVSENWRSYFTSSFHLQNVYHLNNMVESVRVDDPAIKHAPVTMLFLGMITKNKGIFDLLKVIAVNKELLIKKFKLVIGGTGETGHMNKFIESNNIGELVEYKGWVNGTEKTRLLQMSDVYILPSYFEGLPISILEAMGYGKPIISTYVGGIPEVVENDVNGVLITPGNYKELLDAILLYVEDPKNIYKHGSQSLRKIKDYYPEAITPKLENIYRSLL